VDEHILVNTEAVCEKICLSRGKSRGLAPKGEIKRVIRSSIGEIGTTPSLVEKRKQETSRQKVSPTLIYEESRWLGG